MLHKREKLMQALAAAILIPGALVILFPFYWMIAASLEHLSQIVQFPPQLLPHPINWSSFPRGLTFMPFGRYFFNTTEIGVPWAGYNAKLLALTAAGTPPDLYATFSSGFGTFLSKGTLANLNPYVRQVNMNLRVFQASSIAALSRGGNLYGLPMDNMTSLIFYNKTLFDRAHLPLPPSSWKDRRWTVGVMLADARALSKDTNQPARAVWGLNFGLGQIGTPVAWMFGCDPLAAHGGPLNASAYRTGNLVAGQLFFTVPCFTSAMRWDVNLYTRYGVSPSPADLTTLSTLGNPFTTGRIGMEQGLYVTFQNLFLAKPSFQWGVAPIPYGPTGSDLTQQWTDAWVMSAKSPHPELAFKFMLYLTTGPAARQFADMTGFFPALKALEGATIQVDAHAKGMALHAQQLRSVILGGLAKGQAFEAPGHTLANWDQINTTFTNMTSNMALGKQSPPSAMQALTRALKTQLQQGQG